MAAFLRSLTSAAAACLLATGLTACNQQGADQPGAISAGQSKGGDGPGGAQDPKKEPERVVARIAGRTFRLEPALDDPTRVQGLSGRTEIAEDGGMVFVFPRVQQLSFVMRDCLVPIDIMFLDNAGRVLTTHAMTVEEPRRADEPKPEEPWQEDRYEQRLKKYPSRFPSAVAIELKGGKIKELGIQPGDKVELDIEALKKRAR